MKTCRECGLEKSEDLFYKGHRRCKSCYCEEVRRHRLEKSDHYKDYDRNRAGRSDRVEARARYQKTEKGKLRSAEAKKRWIENNVVKRGAHVLVGNAIRIGILVKPESCSRCQSSGKVSAHHDDYSKPLEVRWLCSTCHAEHHKQKAEES